MFDYPKQSQEFKSHLEQRIEKTRTELLSIKTGKPSPSLVEGIMVDAYAGSAKLKIMELATISLSGSQSIQIQPFDPAVLKDIVKALFTSPLNLTPKEDGKTIHITFPPLSQEQREKLIKTVSQKIEEGKVAIRGERDDVRKKIKSAFEQKEITEDDKFRMEKEVDTTTQDAVSKMDEIKSKKEAEMMKI